MRVDTRLCAHCGTVLVRRMNERRGEYLRRVFCSVQCIGKAKASHRASRFWSKVDRRRSEECWPWTGRRSDRGYGQFATSEKNIRAHRYALELSGVMVPADSVVMHVCDNPPCCNPAHLRVGTALDNNRDMVAKGRAVRLRGAANHNTKLTTEQRAAVKARKGERLAIIAKDYGVSRATICRVQREPSCE